jgi:hypothetical protein
MKRKNIITPEDIVQREEMRELGCILRYLPIITPCRGRTTMNHIETGAGGRKVHSRQIPLCEGHHLGPEGIDGRKMSKKVWQQKYHTEQELFALAMKLIGKPL